MKGACLCGCVSFQLAISDLKIYQCHCEQCRKQTGTASSCGSVIKEQNFKWLSGQDNISRWQKQSGFTSHFCSTCGSSVANKFRGRPYYWVPVGLLESDNIDVVINIFSCEKAAWSKVDDSENTYKTKPSVETLLTLLGADV
ncbi:GFA family protein [Agaribacterium sp. ZY112]|uniref:GFA family protein n=1 Tax=Agaribacterium sp. ZY112 TaxID=3233574 RepID=UPI003526936C